MKHFSFDGFTLDPADHLLLRGGQPVPLPPKAFDTLVFLLEHHGRLVTREELMKAVWPDSFVEDANLTVYISLLRKALGEENGRRYIETVPRKGYRLVADVQVEENEAATEAAAPSPEVEPLPSLPQAQSGGSAGTAPHRQVPWLPIAVGVSLAAAALWLGAGRLPRAPELRRVRLTSFGPELALTAAAISPDGKLAAYANPAGVFVQQIETGEATPLAAPAERFTALSIGWYPDGSKLLVGGFGEQADTPSLWTIPVMGKGPPGRLGDGLMAAVSPAGTEIAMVENTRWSPPESTLSVAPEVRILRSDGTGLRTVITGERGEIFGPVEWVRGEHRLLWVRYRWNPQLRRNAGSLSAYDLDTGKISVVRTGSDFTGDIASVSGGRAIYAQLLGSNPSSKYGGKLLGIDSHSRTNDLTEWSEPIAGLSASASGDRLMVRNLVAEHSVFVAELGDAGARLEHRRRLTMGLGREDLPRAWSPDSQAVVFDSNRNGTWELFQQKRNEVADAPLLRSADDLFAPQLSPDGSSFLYMDRPKSWTEPAPVSIERIPVGGGPAEVVLQAAGISAWGLRFECPRVAGRACVLAQRQGERIVFRAFDPIRGFGARDEIARIDADAAHPVAWTISPDGLQLAWARWEVDGARIHVLPLGANLPAAHEVAVEGCSHVHSMRWSADGKGWFVTSEWPASWTMSYAGLDGHLHRLMEGSGTYAPAPDAFPSPDGHYLSFAQRITESNLWLLEGF